MVTINTLTQENRKSTTNPQRVEMLYNKSTTGPQQIHNKSNKEFDFNAVNIGERKTWT